MANCKAATCKYWDDGDCEDFYMFCQLDSGGHCIGHETRKEAPSEGEHRTTTLEQLFPGAIDAAV